MVILMDDKVVDANTLENLSSLVVLETLNLKGNVISSIEDLNELKDVSTSLMRACSI